MIIRGAGSLAIGLAFMGILGTVGTTRGFDPLGGAIFGLFFGTILGLPWALGLTAVIWFAPWFVDRHPALFVVGGGLATCAYLTLFDLNILIYAAPAVFATAISYLLLTFSARRRKRDAP